MRDLFILFVHIIATFARLLGPGGIRSVVAESILIKQQLLILNRSRQRSPNLHSSDRLVAGLCGLLIRPVRFIRSAIVLKPSTLLVVKVGAGVRIDQKRIQAVASRQFLAQKDLSFFNEGRSSSMPTTPYRALRVLLGVVSVLASVVGLLMIFSGKSLLIKLFLNPPESEISTLLLGTIREVGGFALMLSVMLFFAYRDPARNVAIIDALIVGLCILAITPLLSLYTLDIRRLYPDYMIWVRSVGRLALAGILFYLRPRLPFAAQS